MRTETDRPLHSPPLFPPPLSSHSPSSVDERHESQSLTQEQYIDYESRYSVVGAPRGPVVMSRGRGPFVWDINGKRYVDFNSGMAASSQGHCHPRVVDAMARQCQVFEQSSRIVHNSSYPLFAKMMCDLCGFDRLSGGAKAVDLAFKLARLWAYRRKGVPAGQALILTMVGA